MDKTLTLEPTDEDDFELQRAITQYFAEMDALRERMQREDEAIEASRRATIANLGAINEVLAELKAS